MISSCIRAPLFQGMNPPSCKAGSNNWAELLPTSWLPLALSTHISYIITSIHCWQPLSPVCICVGGPRQLGQASLIIQGGLSAHGGPSYYKDQVAGLRSCYLLPSATSVLLLDHLSSTVAADTASVFSILHFSPRYNQSNLTVHCFCN